MEKRAFSIAEAARDLGISRNSCYAAAARGEIPTIAIGRRLLVPATALQRLLDGAETAKRAGVAPGALKGGRDADARLPR